MHQEVTKFYGRLAKTDGSETAITKVGWVLPDCYL